MQSLKSLPTTRGRRIRQDGSHNETPIGSFSNAVLVTVGSTDWISTHRMHPVGPEIEESTVSPARAMAMLLVILTVGVILYDPWNSLWAMPLSCSLVLLFHTMSRTG